MDLILIPVLLQLYSFGGQTMIREEGGEVWDSGIGVDGVGYPSIAT